MSKSDLSWVLVNFLGIILLYLGIASIYSALMAWVSIQEAIEALPESRRASVAAPVRALFFGALLPMAVGTYLLISGRLLHGLLMSVPYGFRDYSQVPGAIAGIELPEEELEEFKNWLHQNPEFSRRAPVDQVALFRDAQAAE